MIRIGNASNATLMACPLNAPRDERTWSLDRRADVTPTDLGRTVSNDQRYQSEDEGNGRRHDGAKPHVSTRRGSLFDTESVFTLLFREFNDQDSVFGSEGNGTTRPIRAQRSQA